MANSFTISTLGTHGKSSLHLFVDATCAAPVTPFTTTSTDQKGNGKGGTAATTTTTTASMEALLRRHYVASFVWTHETHSDKTILCVVDRTQLFVLVWTGTH